MTKSLQPKTRRLIAFHLAFLAGAFPFICFSFMVPVLFPAIKQEYCFYKFRTAKDPHQITKFAKEACRLYPRGFENKLSQTRNLDTPHAKAALLALDSPEGWLTPWKWSNTGVELLGDMRPPTRKQILDKLSFSARCSLSTISGEGKVTKLAGSMNEMIKREILKALKESRGGSTKD